MPEGLAGLRLVSFESRRSEEMASLILRYGGEVLQAPSMREVPLTDQHEAFAAVRCAPRVFSQPCTVGPWPTFTKKPPVR